MDAGARTRLVNDVDGLVGEEAILDVAVGERHSRGQRVFGVLDVVVPLVGLLQAMQDLEGILGRGLSDVDRLKATLEGGVLLDTLAVLLGGRGTDNLNLAAREGRLQDRGRIDGALSRARTDNGVNLVDEEDVVLVLHDLGDDLLEALLELAAIL